jgi:hypothetical protein
MAELPSASHPQDTPPPIPMTMVNGRRILVGIALGTIVVGLVFGLVLSHAHLSGPLGVAPGSSLPAGWQVFRDPAGYFTIVLPPGWTATGGQDGSGTLGDRTGSYSYTDYSWAVRDPASGTSGPGVFISYHPLTNAFGRHFECEAFPHANGTFAGLPAESIGPNAGWLFATESAHYQLNYGFPPSGGLQTTPPTAIPAATFAAGQSLTTQIAATFLPTPDTPLTC